jgi:hypothetical protein
MSDNYDGPQLAQKILRQQHTIDRLRTEVAAKQARIDALMLEFCPQDMTPGQLANWEMHQRKVMR